jgi:glucose-6-phosphate isomerase
MPTVNAPVERLASRLIDDRIVRRIWDRDLSAWHAPENSADARTIRTRLGWLDVGQPMVAHLDRLRRLGADATQERIASVYLLGMGGSSLCGEVLRAVCGVAEGHPQLHVLDTTDERTITDAAAQLDPRRTLFLVSSKSGGTVEVASLERFFWSLVSNALGGQAGRQFIAITDPGTPLQALAESRGYREVFLNPAEIGGRFSALSLFGLVPAALIGTGPAALLASAATMGDACRHEAAGNPGLALGAFIGAAVLAGRDKLTVALPPSFAALGLWIEQLIAESTGKHGKGALPVVDEPLGSPESYGGDRAFVAVASDRDAPDTRLLQTIEDAGHPVLRLTTRAGALGAEFFRWEFATAVAGAAIGINPFDEPNVAEAKEKTRALLEAFAAAGRLPEPSPAATSTTVDVFSPTFSGESPVAVVRAALASLRSGDYVAFLSYLPADRDVEASVATIRLGIRATFRCASTFGVGPRYLHSTGQYHKGGPNTVLAFIVTGDDTTTTEIPGSGYSFSILKRAQALGDAQTLAAHDRRVVRIHVKSAAQAADALVDLFRAAGIAI